MKRILFIRGGAIGDFILTLPALEALCEAYPDARIEMVGYKHIAVLAEDCGWVDAVRSIEYGPLSGFFAKGSELDPELREYFGSFDLVISYLFDPDRIFETNLRRAGAKQIFCGPAKIQNGSHATRQLSAPVEQLGIPVRNLAPKLRFSDEVNHSGREFLGGMSHPIVALHVGSGSPRKNWPLENWIELGKRLLSEVISQRSPSLLVVGGESDQPQLEILRNQWRNQNVRFATSLLLPHLSAILSRCVCVGHDSGISHLAAAAGAKCILLFGPTDPAVWAPQGENVQIVRPPDGRLEDIDVTTVASAIGKLL